MCPRLPGETAEWADALSRNLAESDSFAAAAAGWSASLLFVLEPDAGDDAETRMVRVEIEDGVATTVTAGAAQPADFELRGPMSGWRALLRGEIELPAAVMNGPFEFDGSTIRIMQHRDAVAELVGAARAIETEFAD